MRPTSEYPLNTWWLNHQELRGTEQWRRVEVLDFARDAVSRAVRIEEAWEAYSADHSRPLPNLVECVASYGDARLLVQGWTEFPIEVPADQEEVWREWGLGTTFHEFYDRNIASAAGGFMERATADPAFTATTIQAQLREKCARMTELANKPVEWFHFATPAGEPQDDEAYDAARYLYDDELNRVSELFELVDQLTCFLYALPKLRDFALTEEDPRFGVPSPELYHALQVIDLNHLWAQLDQTEGKLLPIVKLVHREQQYPVNRPTSPEGFWWRHWKPEPRPHQQNRRPRKA